MHFRGGGSCGGDDYDMVATFREYSIIPMLRQHVRMDKGMGAS